ncbi:Gametogenetin-binding 2, partial [Paramuricea clavata]
SKLNEILESIPKCRRNRRCLLHSLETHKSRTPIGCWVDVWEALSQKCQDEVLTINSDTLLDALENHLRKNRFCTECKRKVLKAFGILTGDIDAEKVKGYCPSLYEGLTKCPLHKHVHVPGDVEFLTVLLEKAEHELSGMRRERHAKSMDTAQEENRWKRE